MPDLVRASREKRAEIESLAHRCDDLWQRALGAELLAFLLGLGLGLETSKTLFEGDGDGDDWVTGSMLFDPLGDLGEVFVLLSDVVLFAQIYEEDDGLGA